MLICWKTDWENLRIYTYFCNLSLELKNSSSVLTNLIHHSFWVVESRYIILAHDIIHPIFSGTWYYLPYIYPIYSVIWWEFIILKLMQTHKKKLCLNTSFLNYVYQIFGRWLMVPTFLKNITDFSGLDFLIIQIFEQICQSRSKKFVLKSPTKFKIPNCRWRSCIFVGQVLMLTLLGVCR